jgi:hypothetical protein
LDALNNKTKHIIYSIQRTWWRLFQKRVLGTK